MIEQGAAERQQEPSFHHTDPHAVRDERSMALFEYLVSIVAFLAAVLLAAAR